jgi:carbon-monoxide dehydrogenase large subunit
LDVDDATAGALEVVVDKEVSVRLAVPTATGWMTFWSTSYKPLTWVVSWVTQSGDAKVRVMSILGTRVMRREDPKLLTTGGIYVDDLREEGALWATFVRSTVAHGEIRDLDLSNALRMPGVVAAFSAEDLDVPALVPRFPEIFEAMGRPLLATGRVRFVGEPVAVVLTEQRYQGEDAAEAVEVDYDPLPAVVDPERSLRGDVLLFPEVGTNVASQLTEEAEPDLFDGCDVVVSRRIVNQRMAPCPMEVRGSLAHWGDDGRLTQWVSSQAPHLFRNAVAATLGIERDALRIIAPDVGGGFGSKTGPYPEEVILGWLARRTGRPVRWSETRSESMLGLGHGRSQIQYVTIGGSADGKVLAYRLDIIQDAGAYPFGAFLPYLTRLMASGVYAIEKVQCSVRVVVTNTTPVVAYRGAGRPEATFAIERAMDLFAAEIGVDPAEVRKRNLVPREAFPYSTPTGAVYDSGDYQGALDRVLAASDYQELRAQQASRRRAGDRRQLGIGLSSYVEVTNGAGVTGEFAAVEILPGGKARVYSGTSPHGQGHVTAWSMLASEQLGLPMEDIEVIVNDTDQVASGIGTFGSRSLQSGGLAVYEASAQLVDAGRRFAAELLEADPEDVLLDKEAGRFHVAGTPSVAKSWAELASDAGERGLQLRVEHSSNPPGPTFPFGAHLAVVEVDVETGEVRLVRLVAVDDAGTIINPLLVEGQRHGGLAQGAAQALLEEFRYDEEGNPLTGNLADYAMISAPELPFFELVDMVTPTLNNALGAKGIGESGTIGSVPAVQNAVVDALAHLGVHHIDMPASPERVWRCIEEQRRGT